jgi:hypothetical protein
MKINKISKKEREILVKEISERMKDIVYFSGDRRANQILENYDILSIDPDTKIIVDYKIEFLVNDLLQIISRVRRKG